jgi:hypothetical protein
VSAAVVSHRSALLAYELPIVGGLPRVPELTVPPRGRVDVPGAHMHRANLPREHVTIINGTPTTSVARTVVDVARHHPLQASVPAIDAALHRRLTTREELSAVLLLCWNWPGVRRAQRALRYSDGRAESPLESVSRLTVHAVGLPAAEPQCEIRDLAGRFLGRLDLYWDEFGVGGEADGRDKYDTRDALWAEKERQESIERTGLVIVRWGWDVAWRRPRELERRILAAFERGRSRDRSGFIRGWSVHRPQDGKNAVKTAPTR